MIQAAKTLEFYIIDHVSIYLFIMMTKYWSWLSNRVTMLKYQHNPAEFYHYFINFILCTNFMFRQLNE